MDKHLDLLSNLRVYKGKGFLCTQLSSTILFG